jgi:DNA polymerase-3 subunit delta'
VSFSSIIGHRQIVDLLQRAVARGSVPQSLLLAGPEGVGKHAIAIALAQAVNCEGDGGRFRGATPVPVCPTCQRIARGQHFDVVELGTGGAASIKIEALRERVLEVAGYRPFEAKRRVFIIDPADALTVQAQDALLKTLEEPPSASMLILVTAFPDTLVPTVQSRCRRLRLGPLSDHDVARVLTERCGVEASRAGVLAAVSGGSVARALADEAGQLAEDRDSALALLAAASAGGAVTGRLKAAAALTQHDSGRRDREALGARLGVLAGLLRDLSAILAGDAAAVANADLAADLGRLTASFTQARVLEAWTALDRAAAALDRNASPKIGAEGVALSILKNDPGGRFASAQVRNDPRGRLFCQLADLICPCP